MHALQEAYWQAEEENRKKYTPQKYRSSDPKTPPVQSSGEERLTKSDMTGCTVPK